MSLVDRLLAATRGPERSWPVGKGALLGYEGVTGHDQSLFSPEEYGDYLATSNDIYSVVALRARMMGSLRLKFFSGDESDKTELPKSPAANLWKYVNPFWTAPRLARMDEMSMGTWGQTVHAVERRRGQPEEIWWVKPSRFKPVPDSTGYIKGYLYESVSGEQIAFRPEEITWYRYPNPLDEFAPLSPLAAARLAADTSAAMQQSNQRLFKQGLQIAGLIVPPADKVTFSEAQADDLELQLAKRFSGSQNAHRWAVLRYEAKFQQMQISPKDAEFSAGLNLTFRQVCRAYGMPSPLLNDMEHATLANVRELQKAAWELTLIPDADFRAAEVEEQFLPMFGKRGGQPDHCEFDYSKVAALQEAASESWTREAQAIDRGALTINEWRKSKGYPSVEWGDKPYMPSNKGQIDENGMVQLPQQPEGKQPPDDEVNPSNAASSPRILDHMSARKLLASFHLNGVKV